MRRVRETAKVSDLSDTDTGLSRIGRSTCLGHGTQIGRSALVSSSFEQYWWEERRGSKRAMMRTKARRVQAARAVVTRHSRME